MGNGLKKKTNNFPIINHFKINLLTFSKIWTCATKLMYIVVSFYSLWVSNYRWFFQYEQEH